MPTLTSVGATIATGTYADATTRLDTANEYTNYVQRIEAQIYQKYYLNEGQYFTTLPADIADMKSTGTTWVICFKPLRTTSTAEGNKLTACCNVLVNAGIPFIAVLWQECNDQNFFPSGAAYKTYYNFYAPFIPAGVKRCFDPSGGVVDPTTYYPGDANVDLILLDQYGNKYEANPGYMAALAAICDAHLPAPIPFGMGEWGIASGSVVANIQEMADISNAIIALFTARNAADKQSGPVMYWGGQGKNGNNVVVNASDPKIPYIQAVHDALQGGTPPPPPATGQTVFGYPDYVRVTQGQSVTFNEEVTGVGAAGKTVGPFYVGTAPQSFISVTGAENGEATGVAVNYYADQAASQFVARKVAVTAFDFPVSMPVTNRGPWMTVTVNTVTNGHTVNVFIIAYNNTTFIDNLLDTDVTLFQLSEAGMAAGTNVQEQFNTIYGGPVILHADGGVASYKIVLSYVPFIALGSQAQMCELHSQDLGARFDKQLTLPWSPITIGLYNTDATNALFGTQSVLIDR